MQDCASRERVSTKALIEDETMDGEGRAKQDARAENGCSIVEINNAGDDPLSPCPKGTKLENQLRFAALVNGITIVFVLRLDLIS
ncbi:MAG: hypothetical protein WBC60_14180 [Cognaticolwellia sp.]